MEIERLKKQLLALKRYDCFGMADAFGGASIETEQEDEGQFVKWDELVEILNNI